MSTTSNTSSSSNYMIYGLRTNPFSPATTENRSRDLQVLVGEEYKSAVRRLLDTLEEAINKKSLMYALILGRRGTGKTAILYEFLNNAEKYQPVVIYYIPRVPHTSFRSFILEFIDRIVRGLELTREIKEYHKESLDKLIEALPDLILKLVKSKSPRGGPVIMVWDQLENLVKVEKDELQSFKNFLRNLPQIFKDLGLYGIFAISTTPEKYEELVTELGREVEFIRDLKAGLINVPERLTLDDTFILFRSLLSKVRVYTEEIKKRLEETPYYPFDENAIKAIYDAADGVPGVIYGLASRILDEAVSQEIDYISEAFVHDVLLQVRKEWYRALSIPPQPLKNVLYEIIQAAKELGCIRDFIMIEGGLKNYVFILDSMGLKELREKKEFSNLERVLLDRSIIDFIVIYDTSEKTHLTFVKTARKMVRRDTIEALAYLLTKITSFRYGPVLIPKDKLKVVILYYGSVSKAMKSILEQVSLAAGAKVEFVRIDINNPYLYGRLMSVFNRIRSLKRLFQTVKAIPISTKESLRLDIREVLDVLGIISAQ